MTNDVTDWRRGRVWQPRREWSRERLQVGGEYVCWPQDRAMKQNRGRRCVFLGFVPAFYGTSIQAKVRCTDNNQIETLPSADLIPAYFVTAPRGQMAG